MGKLILQNQNQNQVHQQIVFYAAEYQWLKCIDKMHTAKLRGHLVHVFKHMFSVFKQHYTYFHTFFHPHVFPKKLKTVV